VNFDSLVETCFAIWQASLTGNDSPTTVTVLGPPGTGKTSAGRELADKMTSHIRAKVPNAPPAQCVVLDLSSMLPEDLMGLPFRDENVTRYCPQSWLAPLCEKDAYGVLVLDDLPASSVQVQVACRQGTLERRFHEMHLAKGVFVMVTGNRRQDKSAASTLPAHFRNSVVLLPFEPDFKGWESWYMDQGYDSDVPAFLHFRKAHFSRLPKDADDVGAYATPRSWSMLGKLCASVPEERIGEVASGLVGNGVSTEFQAFRMLRRKLVAPEKVLEDPERALPNPGILDSPDKVIAMVTGLGEIAARKAKGKGTVQVLGKYLRALSYVSRSNREYVAVSISTFTAAKGSVKRLVDAARANRKDPLVRELVNYLADTLEL